MPWAEPGPGFYVRTSKYQRFQINENSIATVWMSSAKFLRAIANIRRGPHTRATQQIRNENALTFAKFARLLNWKASLGVFKPMQHFLTGWRELSLRQRSVRVSIVPMRQWKTR